MSRQDFGERIRTAVRHHAWLTRACRWGEAEVQAHIDKLLSDLRRTPRRDWPWYLDYFEGRADN